MGGAAGAPELRQAAANVVPAGAGGEAKPKEAAPTATEKTAKEPQAIALGKATFRRQIEASLADAYAIASRAMVENLALPSARAVMAAASDRLAAGVWFSGKR